MAQARTLLIAGAGIAGLSAGLCLARQGYRAVIVEQSPALREVGAGIQLSPNASRILIGLGLEETLAAQAIVPEGLSVKDGRSGRQILLMPLGAQMQFRYGAPYWVLHRADLQRILAQAVQQHPDVELRLATRLEDFALHPNGITALVRTQNALLEERVLGLIGADGLWSSVRAHLGGDAKLRAVGRTAWRATVPQECVPATLQRQTLHLWLGASAHVVLYPLRQQRLFNLVVIVADRWSAPGWSEPGDREELQRRISPREWNADVRRMLQQVESWQKWALFEGPGRPLRGRGPVTLIGDAAHPMLPFLAQGAAMAIEDAAVLARCLAGDACDIAQAMRRYEGLRAARVRRVQDAARANGRIYHFTGMRAALRDVAMRSLGGNRLRARYDWLYDWRPDQAG